tara:strand:- start:110 stop:220 length:111 start_codon:yes stop_codon:yes gene_type:complete
MWIEFHVEKKLLSEILNFKLKKFFAKNLKKISQPEE